MQTRFTALVGCSVPLQQAPMGAVSSPDLAVAVADAGGVGTITCLGVPTAVFVRRLDDMRRRTPGVLSANVLLEDTDEDAVVAAAERVRVVDFFWFDPSPRLVDLVHRAGALVGWQVGSVEEARVAADAGCDLVTAQGREAGGHVRGDRPLLPLLAEVLDAVPIPVLAAGGIADAHAFAAVLSAGADGARIGTAFVATTESAAHPVYKQALVDAAGDGTVLSSAFARGCPLCTIRPRHRVLRSAVERAAASDEEVIGTVTAGGGRVALPRGAGLPPHTAVDGDVAAMALYAGAGVGAVTAVRTAAEVVADLTSALTSHDGPAAPPS
ncbi:nitronate monooxygenase [Blastococcus sp. KM273128]|nr:nitronate monooxygenase [Blastococcus sp. KM273128]MCF6743460.1 nitronate monooxygenase [Blastococcus sp. KM273128]